MSDSAAIKPHAGVPAVDDLAGSAMSLWEILGFTKEPQDDHEQQSLVYGDVRLLLGCCPDALPPPQLGDQRYCAFVTTDNVSQLHRDFTGQKPLSGLLIKTSQGAGGKRR